MTASPPSSPAPARPGAKTGARSLLAQKPTVQVDSCFGEITAFEGDLITRQIAEFGNHTRPEFTFAVSVMAPGARVFDLGAHIGTFSMTALRKLSPRGRLLAVEGSVATHAILRENLTRLTGTLRAADRGPGAAYMADADTLNAFANLRPGDFNILENRDNTGASMLVPRAERPHTTHVTTESLGIDDLVDRYFAPDYIKMDTEGTEGELLAASTHVARARPTLYVEINARTLAAFDTTVADMDRLLQGLGYRFFINGFDRNAAHDLYKPVGIETLCGRGDFFDVLCIHKDADIAGVLSRYPG